MALTHTRTVRALQRTQLTVLSPTVGSGPVDGTPGGERWFDILLIADSALALFLGPRSTTSESQYAFWWHGTGERSLRCHARFARP